MSLSFTTTLPKPDEIPVAIEATGGTALSTCIEWAAEEKGALTDLLDRHGVILLRGFPIRTAQDFDRLIKEFGWENFKCSIW